MPISMTFWLFTSLPGSSVLPGTHGHLISTRYVKTKTFAKALPLTVLFINVLGAHGYALVSAFSDSGGCGDVLPARHNHRHLLHRHHPHHLDQGTELQGLLR